MTDTLKALDEIEAALKEALVFNEDSDAGPDVELCLNDVLSALPTLRAALTPPAAVEDGELRRLMAEATPGPWKLDGYDESPDIHGPAGWAVALGECSQNCGYIHWNNLADADLIVAAVNALPGLLARVAELEKQVNRLTVYERAWHKGAGGPP